MMMVDLCPMRSIAASLAQLLVNLSLIVPVVNAEEYLPWPRPPTLSVASEWRLGVGLAASVDRALATESAPNSAPICYC